MLSFPSQIMVFAVVGLLGINVQNVIIANVFIKWAWYARMIRTGVMQYRDRNFIQFSRCVGMPERFILFCDDLSFEEGEAGYKALKSVLDGSVSASGDNVLIYATSNRRHLMPEYMSENLAAKHQPDGEIHPGETVEEKISLSERFGLWLSFYPFKQDDYLDIVYHWLRELGCPEAQIEPSRTEALQWTIERGSRSGRVAYQFARDWAARHV